MKKAYHAACKEEKLATSRENNSKLESNTNTEAQKKLQEKVEKCQQDVQKVCMCDLQIDSKDRLLCRKVKSISEGFIGLCWMLLAY